MFIVTVTLAIISVLLYGIALLIMFVHNGDIAERIIPLFTAQVAVIVGIFAVISMIIELIIKWI